MKQFLAMLLATLGLVKSATLPAGGNARAAEQDISLGTISKSREGMFQTLNVVYRIEGDVDKEAILPAGALRTYKQTSGITTGQILDAVLSILNEQGLAGKPLRNSIGEYNIENYRRYIHATGNSVHELYNADIGIAISARPGMNYIVLKIVQHAKSPLLPWNNWLTALSEIDGFAQAVLVDSVFDYFQNHSFLSVHREAGRDVSKLTLLPNREDTVDISRNPGRTEDGYGYQELIGSEMWLGEELFKLAGYATKECLLSGKWPSAEVLSNGFLYLKASPECFNDQTAPSVMDALRELVYADARQAAQRATAALNADRERRMEARRKGLERAQEQAERDEALFASQRQERETGQPERGASIPPKPPYDPDLPVTGFGYKFAWLAVRTDDVPEVARALGLRNARWLPWSFGIGEAHGGDLIAITPAIDGWVLVLGERLFDWHANNFMIAEISKRFGEAQYFITHRVSDAHHWSRWIDGRAIRSMDHLDGFVQNGESTEIEGNLLLPLYRDNDWINVDEGCVMRVAGEWSVDPTSLQDKGIRESHVLVGNLP